MSVRCPRCQRPVANWRRMPAHFRFAHPGSEIMGASFNSQHRSVPDPARRSGLTTMAGNAVPWAQGFAGQSGSASQPEKAPDARKGTSWASWGMVLIGVVAVALLFASRITDDAGSGSGLVSSYAPGRARP